MESPWHHHQLLAQTEAPPSTRCSDKPWGSSTTEKWVLKKLFCCLFEHSPPWLARPRKGNWSSIKRNRKSPKLGKALIIWEHLALSCTAGFIAKLSGQASPHQAWFCLLACAGRWPEGSPLCLPCPRCCSQHFGVLQPKGAFHCHLSWRLWPQPHKFDSSVPMQMAFWCHPILPQLVVNGTCHHLQGRGGGVGQGTVVLMWAPVPEHCPMSRFWGSKTSHSPPVAPLGCKRGLPAHSCTLPIHLDTCLWRTCKNKFSSFFFSPFLLAEYENRQ